jgi:hypothetical protein
MQVTDHHQLLRVLQGNPARCRLHPGRRGIRRALLRAGVLSALPGARQDWERNRCRSERLRFATVRRRLTTCQVRLSSFVPSGRNSPFGEMCRYRVCRVMPSSWHRSPTLVSGWHIAAIARRSLAAVILNGRPPFRPRARAEARPATVRSAISSRSNSASAAKMPKTSLPAAVVVSMAAPWPGQHLQSDTAPGQVVHGIDQVAQVTPEPVQFPHHQRIPLAQRLQAARQARAVFALARCLILVKMGGIDARSDSARRAASRWPGSRPPSIPACSQSASCTCHIYVRLCDSVNRKVLVVKICHLTRHSV